MEVLFMIMFGVLLTVSTMLSNVFFLHIHF